LDNSYQFIRSAELFDSRMCAGVPPVLRIVYIKAEARSARAGTGRHGVFHYRRSISNDRHELFITTY